mmetsp:Transcript_4259/g.7019  ORF Transcript_4259/g.7019 Transcript_4259/m.7019 type:complete len:126 (-) Transcript_4259:83-460(-)
MEALPATFPPMGGGGRGFPGGPRGGGGRLALILFFRPGGGGGGFLAAAALGLEGGGGRTIVAVSAMDVYVVVSFTFCSLPSQIVRFIAGLSRKKRDLLRVVLGRNCNASKNSIEALFQLTTDDSN